VERQVAIIYAGTNGFMDTIALSDVRAYEIELYRFIESRYPQLFGGIREKKQLDDEIKPMLNAAVETFTKEFTARKAAAA
jgi:F-type H+-transporting ATPase subunit alpha